MNIEKLEITNFRGFQGKQKTINFSSKINVFVGVNGAGKTSILDLLAIFLNQFSTKLSGTSNREIEYTLNQLDININEKEIISKIYIKPILNYIPNPFFEFDKEILFWEIIRDFEGSRSNYQQLNRYIKIYQDLLLKNSNYSIPIFKYFQSQRITNEKHKHFISKKRYLVEQFKAYDDAFDKNMEFDEFIQWFIEEENIENREKIAHKDFNYENPNLRIIRKALKIFFSEFKNDKYTNLRVEDRTIMSKMSEKSSLVIDKNANTYNLKQLSDGEKNLILIVSDIAHRLSIANPNTQDALNGEGIILIDEIDLHLHPVWQREVIPCLLKTFPNLQFITTTHSPQVLSNINPENIYIIEDFNFIELTPNTFGNDSNTILWDIFGVSERPEHTKAKLEKLYEIIEEDDKQDEAKNLLDELTLQLGDNNSEILRAKLHFDFQNKLD
jgi:predicted ATP-binding protein involved in virulence